MNTWLVVGGFAVGFVVGLTGMGGGALMTPMLVFFFHINPLAAVSSDVVTTAVMKPFGGAVHVTRGTVNRRMVLWLCVGSVPSAFAGVLILREFGASSNIDGVVRVALGVALLIASIALVAKAYLGMLERIRRERAGQVTSAVEVTDVVVRPVPTVLVGVVGGLVVGMTSVGSGSLIIVLILLLYPALQTSSLVGTDLVQAVPLVAAAAVGHLIFGDFQLAVSVALVLGSVPGVLLGALCSARARGGLIRKALAIVLLASSLKLLEVPTPVVALVVGAALVLGPVGWMAARHASGLPARARTELRHAGHEPGKRSPVGIGD